MLALKTLLIFKKNVMQKTKFFLVIDTTLPSNICLCFRENLLERM